MSEKNKNIVHEPITKYEQAEMVLLREALNRTHQERFLFLTQLYKIQQTLSKAKITYRNSPDSK
jgi:hypothetical protein